jgi:hypothetical protein
MEINSTRPTVKLKITSDVSLDLRIEAKRRGIDRDDLVAAIIAAVVDH